MKCDELRELAPDIALGIADGEQRAEALRHLADCADCRRFIEQLSEVTDELLMLAPVHEPPEGFETRVIGRLGLRRPRRRSMRRGLLRWAGAPAASAALTAAALVAVFHDDHVTADRYRHTLDTAHGQYFQADKLLDPAGSQAGVTFAYEGKPSWVFVTVDAAHRRAVETGQLVIADGRRVPLSGFWLNPRDGTWGGAISVPLRKVASVRLLGKNPGDVLVTTIHPDGAGDTGT
jgi:hypothetical protein